LLHYFDVGLCTRYVTGKDFDVSEENFFKVEVYLIDMNFLLQKTKYKSKK
jgi:hypothetical protein